ncbi:MAG: MotA/TolQ/ExbB proton channel family protein [Bacteriovoracaceae bacterium]|jgi:chemotaxis protein MotA|nr:MotA/TolQ/ExbB proton channel family protein [Bacteriovoracaceae bacterium]
MKSSILGLIAGIIIVSYAVSRTTDDILEYINFVSILIVFGGTVSAAIITHGFRKIIRIFLMFFKAFKTHKYDNVKIVKELVRISEDLSQGKEIDSILKQDSCHPYTRDGLRLISNKLSDDKIVKISKTMLKERQMHYKDTISQLEVLAKYPPAFGMMGTIIGLIAVMKNMSADAGLDAVGPSMAVALITTLYGIFIANYIISPIGDNLNSGSKRDLKIRRIISEGILLLNKKENPVFVREVLMGYLLPLEREALASELGVK